MTAQPYIDLLPQESIVHEETRSELDEALRLNPDKYAYYVCESSVHDIVVQVLTERLGFVKIDIRGAYYYSTWRTSCIEVPASIVQIEEKVIDIDDTIDADDEDTWYVVLTMKENE